VTQITIFNPGDGGHETLTVPERLITHRDDPATSKRAARKVARSGNIGRSLALFLTYLDHGPLTVREASNATTSPNYWMVEWDKRVKAWHVAGHIELTGEERGGGRVWRRAQ
jgi:hypothetical protein